MFNKKNKTVTLEAETADQILQNVFSQANVTPNTIPLDVLTSYSNYRKDRYALQRTVLVIVLVLFLLLPLLFLGPRVLVETVPQETPGSVIYHVTVETIVPISKVTAVLDGRNVPVYEASAKEFTVEPSDNGKLVLTVTLINGQVEERVLGVWDVDNDAPVLARSDYDDTQLYLYLTEEGSGVDMANTYALDTDGREYRPLAFDEETNMITFAYPRVPMNIYIADKAGNVLQLVVTFA